MIVAIAWVRNAASGERIPYHVEIKAAFISDFSEMRNDEQPEGAFC